jgi:hypothetical protein
MYGDDEQGRKEIAVLNSTGWYAGEWTAYDDDDDVGGGSMSRMPVRVCALGGLTGEVSCHEGPVLICS